MPRIPGHVAVIMDGNGRWARARGLPAVAGHRAGVEVIRKLLRSCRENGVGVLTLFAFSSENWQRPREEVRGLMALFMRYLRGEVRELHRNGIRLRIIGDRTRFAPRLRRLMEESEALTALNEGFTLVIAADYGGQWDIVQAARALAAEVAAGRLQPNEIDAGGAGGASEPRRPAAPGPADPHRRRPSHQQFPAVADRLHGAVFHRVLLAGFRRRAIQPPRCATTRRASAASGGARRPWRTRERRDAEAARPHRTGVCRTGHRRGAVRPGCAHRGAVRPAGAGCLVGMGRARRVHDARRAPGLRRPGRS
jgi:undecaprenyl diphosphate synthase